MSATLSQPACAIGQPAGGSRRRRHCPPRTGRTGRHRLVSLARSSIAGTYRHRDHRVHDARRTTRLPGSSGVLGQPWLLHVAGAACAFRGQTSSDPTYRPALCIDTATLTPAGYAPDGRSLPWRPLRQHRDRPDPAVPVTHLAFEFALEQARHPGFNITSQDATSLSGP